MRKKEETGVASELAPESKRDVVGEKREKIVESLTSEDKIPIRERESVIEEESDDEDRADEEPPLPF